MFNKANKNLSDLYWNRCFPKAIIADKEGSHFTIRVVDMEGSMTLDMKEYNLSKIKTRKRLLKIKKNVNKLYKEVDVGLVDKLKVIDRLVNDIALRMGIEI